MEYGIVARSNRIVRSAIGLRISNWVDIICALKAWTLCMQVDAVRLRERLNSLSSWVTEQDTKVTLWLNFNYRILSLEYSMVNVPFKFDLNNTNMSKNVELSK